MTLGRTLLRSLPSVFVAALVVMAARAQTSPIRIGTWAPKLAATVAGMRGDAARAAAAGPTGTLSGDEPQACPAGVAVAVSGTVVYFAQGDQRVYWRASTITADEDVSIQIQSFAPTTYEVTLGLFKDTAQDPTLGSVPLARALCFSVNPGMQWLDATFDRPIVQKLVTGADPVTRVAFSIAAQGSSVPSGIMYDDNGPADLAPAMVQTGSTFSPIPGTSPVVNHQVCFSSDHHNPSLRVLAQSLASNVTVTATTAQFVQTFTVPATVTVEWVELALDSSPSQGPIQVAIVDPTGLSVPASSPLPTSDTAGLITPGPGQQLFSVWAATTKLQRLAQLVPGHTYWLCVDTGNQWSMRTTLSSGGTNYPDGTLFRRPGSTGAFTADPNRDLAFRIIGVPDFIDPGPPPQCGPLATSVVTPTVKYDIKSGFIIAQSVTLTAGLVPNISQFSFPVVTVWDNAVEAANLRWGVTGTSTLPPDVSTLVLRSSGCRDCATITAEGPGWESVSYGNPVIVHSVTQAADATDRNLAMELIGRDVYVPGTTQLAPAGVGYRYEANAPTLTPIVVDDGTGYVAVTVTSGTLGRSMCTAPEPNGRQLEALQQIIHWTERIEPTATSEVVQQFRVPVTGEFEWMEIGLPSSQVDPGFPLEMELIAPLENAPDNSGLYAGPVIATMTAGASLFTSPTTITRTAGLFEASTRQPVPITLTSGVDYWLRAKLSGAYGAISVTHTPRLESGKLFVQSGPLSQYAELSNRDLAFRLIGVTRSLADAATSTAQTVYTSPPCTATSVLYPPNLATQAPRRMAQGITCPTPTAMRTFQVAVGSDGDPETVTLTARIAFAGGPTQTSCCYGAEYPLDNVVLTVRGSNFGYESMTTSRPIVVCPITSTPTILDRSAAFIIGNDAPVTHRTKVGLCATALTMTAAIEDRGFGWVPVTGTSSGSIGGWVDADGDPEGYLWRVAQQVTKVGGIITATVVPTVECVQSFRVAAPVRADWIELAIPSAPSQPALRPRFHVAVVPATSIGAPPPTAINVTTTANFEQAYGMELGDTWAASSRFTSPPMLVPGQLYWLVLQGPAGWAFGTTTPATATADEYPDGAFYQRSATATAWSGAPLRDLAFRIIGVPNGTISAPQAPRVATVFTLRADPQPFSRELAFRWNGGIGRTRIEIFDVNGRRVRRIRDAGSATEGFWIWRGEGDSGQRMGAGVYFARVYPGNGRAIQRRIVYVH